MTISRMQLAIIVTLALSLLLPIALDRRLRFEQQLSPAELAISRFTPAPPAVPPQRLWQQGTLVPNPLGTPPQPAGKPPQAVAATPAAVVQERLPAVSLIVQGDGRPTAILDGTLVREGETVRSWRIARIERNRVLLEGRKGTRWIHLD